MFTNRPVILALFANNRDAYLDHLVKEQHAIADALSDADDEGSIKYYPESFTSNDRMNDLLTEYHNRLIMIHFGGHAGDSHLEFRDGISHSIGLATRFQDIPVVFLNGCATHGQVENLLQKGVKAVIATSTAINDSKAVEFATTFYKMLGKGHTLSVAFEQAQGALLAKYGEKTPLIKKGLKLRRDKEEKEFPWGLYTNNSTIEQWKLPDTQFLAYQNTIATYQNPKIIKPNNFLLKSIYSKIKKHNPIVSKLRSDYRNKGKVQPILPEVIEAILRSFLAPISEELRKLFTEELSKEFSINRLSAFAIIYQRTTKLIAFILLSDLWDNVKHLELSDTTKRELQYFFEIDKYTAPDFNYFDLIKTLMKSLPSTFITELPLLDWAEKGDFVKAADFLQRIPSLASTINEDEMRIKSCQRAEEALTTFLSHLYFLVGYKMLIVKNIKVEQLKNQPTEYLHEVVELDNNKNNPMTDYTQKFEPHTDSQAVILFKERVNLGLNLSPFIIDKNTLTQERNSKIYFYNYKDKNNVFCFDSIVDNEVLFTNTPQFKELNDQIEQAKKGILKIKNEPSKDSEEAEEGGDTFDF